MSATSLTSSATIVVRSSRSNSTRDSFSPRADLEPVSGKTRLVNDSIDGCNKGQIIDASKRNKTNGDHDDNQTDDKEEEKKLLSIKVGHIETLNQREVNPTKSVSGVNSSEGGPQNEPIKTSRFVLPILRASPTRSSSGSKPLLKSISNIVENSKTSSYKIVEKPTSSIATATVRITTIDNDDYDEDTSQSVPKELTNSSNVSVSKDLSVFSRSNTTIITNGSCAITKPLVINHHLLSSSPSSSSPLSSNADTKTSSNSQRDEVASLSTTDLMLSSLITAQQSRTATAKTRANTCSNNPASSGACSVGRASAQNESRKVTSKLSDTSSSSGNQTLSRSNKQLAAIQQSLSPPNGPQAVTARLMDLGKRLLEASRQGYTDIVRQLVVNSGAPFTSDWLGTTALHLAAQNGHAEIAEILLRGGVNRDARTKLERTALHLAAQGGSLEVVDLLLLHGSDVNARDMLKMSPLHWAVERGHICVVEKLLLSGADVRAKSKFSLTPIDIALNSDNYEMMDLFKVSDEC